MALSAEDQPPLDHVQPLPPPAAVRRDIPPPRRPAPGRPPPPRGVVRLVEVRTDQIPAVPPEPERPPLLVRSTIRWRFTASIILVSIVTVVALEVLRREGISLYPSSLITDVILIVVAAILTSVVMTALTTVVDRLRSAEAETRQLRNEIVQTRAAAAATASGVTGLRRDLVVWQGETQANIRAAQQDLRKAVGAFTEMPDELRHDMRQGTRVVEALLDRLADEVRHRMRMMERRLTELTESHPEVMEQERLKAYAAGLAGRSFGDEMNVIPFRHEPS